MNKIIIALCLVTVCYQSVNANDISAVDLIGDIYRSCISQYSTSCIKPKALSWLSNAVNQDTIKITEDMTIVRTGEDVFDTAETRTDAHPIVNLVDKVDSFLSSHALRIESPEILKTEEARSYIPKSLLKGGLADGLQIPLVEGNVAEGRSFVKRVMIPFILGLKFKTTVLVPLALALIALKTWKAMTLGLLSLVMTAAMVIFKFAKPKIVNYEVVHYPHPIEHHHVPHPIEHHHVPHPIEHHHLPHSIEHHHVPHVHAHAPHMVLESTPAWARNFDAQEAAYNAYL